MEQVGDKNFPNRGDWGVYGVASTFIGSGGRMMFVDAVNDWYTKAVRPIIEMNSGIQAEYVEAYNDTYNIYNLQ